MQRRRGEDISVSLEKWVCAVRTLSVGRENMSTTKACEAELSLAYSFRASDSDVLLCLCLSAFFLVYFTFSLFCLLKMAIQRGNV